MTAERSRTAIRPLKLSGIFHFTVGLPKNHQLKRCQTLFQSKTKVPRENQCHRDTKETDMDTEHGLQRLLYVEFRIGV